MHPDDVPILSIENWITLLLCKGDIMFDKFSAIIKHAIRMYQAQIGILHLVYLYVK